MDPVRPDLAGASTTGLIPALLGERDASWLPDPVRDASSVVVLVLDGLGWHALEEHPDRLPTLRGMSGGPITTVVPSTTSTALTSITTGRAPGEHGIVGFRMRVDDAVLNVLRWEVAGNGRRPDPVAVQPFDPFLGRDVPVVTKTEFHATSFSMAHMRGARFSGWRTPMMLVQNCRELIRDGERLVYTYYDGVDIVAHARGLHDAFFPAELDFTDRLVRYLLEVLPGDAALLVTADHGQVHLEPDAWVQLDPLLPLIATHTGDARFRFLHAVNGAAQDLLDGARERFADRAWVFSREQLIDEGWLGERALPAVRPRIGDVVLAARDPIAFVDPSLHYETTLRSGHGSLTPAEMLVPLLAARGTA